MSAHKCNKCGRLHLIKWKNDTNVIKQKVSVKCEVFGCGGFVVNQFLNKNIDTIDVQPINLGPENGVNENVKNFHLTLEK